MRSEAGTFLPDESELLSRLWLNATDASRVCGVTVRQLTYWTDRGIVATRDGDNRTYDMQALRRVIAIKRIMLEGFTLEKAAQLVEKHDMAAQQADLAVSPSYLDDTITRVHAFVPKVAAYLALGRLNRLAAALVGTDLERCFEEGANDGAVAVRVAETLDQASVAVDRALSELARPAVADVASKGLAPAPSAPV